MLEPQPQIFSFNWLCLDLDISSFQHSLDDFSVCFQG